MSLIAVPTYGMFYAGILCPWMNNKVCVVLLLRLSARYIQTRIMSCHYGSLMAVG